MNQQRVFGLMRFKNENNKNKKDKKEKSENNKKKKDEPAEGEGEDANSVKIEGWLRVASNQFEDKQPLMNKINEKLVNKSIEIVSKAVDGEGYLEKIHSKGKFRKNSHAGNGPPSIDSFYFRISGSNIYYTETQADSVVLGAISFKNVQKVKKTNIGEANKCFKVMNDEFEEWDLCVMDEEENCDKWVCAIQTQLGKKCTEGSEEAGDGEGAGEEEKKEEDKKEEAKVTEILEQPIYMLPLPSPICHIDFNFNSHGDDWKTCNCMEPNQSPVDLPDVTCAESMKRTPKFEYPTLNKHDIEILYQYNILRLRPVSGVSLGSVLDIDGTRYGVSEIQFKTPSDHKIKGQGYPLEVQVVHEAIAGDYKRQLIVSILYKQKAGAKMPFFSHLDILSLPNPNTQKTDCYIGETFSIHMFTQLEEFLETPVPFSYYRYEGTRSSPPCTPHTTWIVTSEPINLGSTVTEMIRDSLKDPVADPNSSEVPLNFDGNNRDVQPIGDRQIKYYNRESGCDQDGDDALKRLKEMEEEKNNNFGHYEKVQKKQTHYFFVTGHDPSGVPNALVVSSKEAEGH